MRLRQDQYKKVLEYVNEGWSFPTACAKAGMPYENLNEDRFTDPYLREARIIHLDRSGKHKHLNEFIAKSDKEIATMKEKKNQYIMMTLLKNS